ncbi:MAG: V-type ATP synthase subunit E [Clostridiales bacterium]|nr:V-type ATP synthase subunit E [Candidatus Blautia equi]
MNTEVKIKHFRETAIRQARDLSEDQVEAHQQAMAAMEVEHKKTRKKNAELTYQMEEESARREAARVLAAETLNLRHAASGRQMELKEQLFEEVKERLLAFKKTPEYETYLLTKIREAVAFAEKDKLQIYLSSEDAALCETLSEKSGFKLEISEASFGGGILASIPEKNIQINNTFKNGLAAVFKEFTFDGRARV